MTERKTDETLLQQTSNEPEAFAAFYERHEQAVLLFFLRRTANAETAADLTAETFAAALSSARRFRSGPQPAVAWLFGIANHKLAASYRRGRVEDRARRKLGMEPLIVSDEALEAVEALADAQRSGQVMADLLDALPSDQREAIQLRILDEREYEDIATALRCSSAVVRQRVSRGLRGLRQELTKETT